jgi:hypothetical protein
MQKLMDAVGTQFGFEKYQRLNQTAWDVLMTMAKYSESTDYNSARVETIARNIGLRTMVVEFALQRLRVEGFIEREGAWYRILHGPDQKDPERLVLQPKEREQSLLHPDSEEIVLPPRRRRPDSEQYLDETEEKVGRHHGN